MPTSTASAASAKPYAFVAALKAVKEHLSRTGITADVSEAGPSLVRVRRSVKEHPRITIVLPIDSSSRRIFGVDTPLARNVTLSLLEKTTYNNYSIIFVASEQIPDVELAELVAPFKERAKTLRVPMKHSLPQYLNSGLIACETSMAVLLDQHCDFVDGDWIETLLGYATRDNVAMIAPHLVDQFGTLLSAGLSMTPEPHEIAQGHHANDLGPVGMYAMARECFGVSTRCALVDAVAIKRVGGFSPDYSDRWCDFDLASKLHSVGKHAIITPLVRVRCFDDPAGNEDGRALLEDRWGRLIGADPFTRVDTRLREPLAMH